MVWRDAGRKLPKYSIAHGATRSWLAPDIDTLPFVDRRFLPQDPYRAEDGRLEANLVCSRGCPCECTFCGAAASMNPDVTIRTRDPHNIIDEMDQLHEEYGVTAFRAFDDLFLGARRVIRPALKAFADARIGERCVGRDRPHQHPGP
ncbi:hypothetical protein [Streptomyces sp. DH12]|uniref:hypothetical protein n=1 Tax=Streptomyces sp. DH12 TaxID=2857010 RepID=UPI001E5ABE4F|nr:hypothetical protein [Streptomyces sp. DH12]